MIPLVDLRAQLAPIREELDTAVRGVIDETAFILGPAVEKFEKAFAEYVGVPHCVGVNSGTAALQLALMAAGVGPGDEVITTPATFFATAEAISLASAKPVFVDVEPDTLNLDATKLEAAITKRTRAIVPVHLYGQAADLRPILEVAKHHNLLVVEDACQAHGATYEGKRVGSLGVAAAFSFYPGKNLGAMGEAGAVTTADDGIATRIRHLRDHGSPEKYRHTMVGYNYRIEGIQGAVLGVKLKYLDGWNERRRVLAKRYLEELRGVGDLELPTERSYGKPVWHLFTVRSARREKVFEHFKKVHIACAIHYPIPIHLQEAYVGLGHKAGDFPISEKAAKQTLSLPLYPELTEAQQGQVIDAIRVAFA